MSSTLRRLLSDCSCGVIRAVGASGRGLRILMYHRVTDAHPRQRLCVSPQAFAEQMQWLSDAGYRTITFDQAVRWVTGQGARPDRSCVITFDDGFEDNFRHAAPALVRHQFTGCFFIPTLFAQSDPKRHAPEDRPMSWHQLNELLAQGHEIGAHSVTHRKLARLPLDAVRHEVEESKAVLDHELRRPVEFFCYPAGSYTAHVRAAVQAAGYRGACTVEPGANHPGADPFTLKRTEVSRFDSLWDFEKKMTGAYDWLHAAVQTVHRFTQHDRECANALEVPATADQLQDGK